jgi:hypothetical protein
MISAIPLFIRNDQICDDGQVIQIVEPGMWCSNIHDLNVPAGNDLINVPVG